MSKSKGRLSVGFETLNVPVPRGKGGKTLVKRTGGTGYSQFSEEVRKHLEALDKALEGNPISFDSLGNGYYLGPTVGQILSWYFGDHVGVFSKIKKRMEEGTPLEMILVEAKKENPELRLEHIKYVRDRVRRDNERIEDYQKKCRDLQKSKREGMGDNSRGSGEGVQDS